MAGRPPARWSYPVALLLALLAAVAGLRPAAGNEPVRRAIERNDIAVPVPHLVQTRRGPVPRPRTEIAALATAPFPYDGVVPATNRPFVETIEEDGRRGRRTGRGQILWEDETYSDARVLLHIPRGFDIRRPAHIVVFFHGHGATIDHDVAQRQRVPAQIARSGANVVLVAPQLAVNAPDSSIGKLWQPGGFARFLGEAARNLGQLHGDPTAARSFASMPVVIIAYSGGYVAAAWSAHHGGIGRRLRGMVLLDGLYGETEKLTDWLERERGAFFVSAFADSTRRRNEQMREALAMRNRPALVELGPKLRPGTIAFIDAGVGASHRDFVTEAWVRDPVSDVLARLVGPSRR